MKNIPKIKRERISQLRPGALLKIGKQTVIFNRYFKETDYKGELTNFIEYTRSDGHKCCIDDFIVCQCATENLDAEPCAYCGKFREPADLKTALIRMYRKSVQHIFCREGRCAEYYQSTIKTPPLKTRNSYRNSKWRRYF